MSEFKLIVGLGNPGEDYENTRHNLGFLTVQRLAEKIGVKFSLSSSTNSLTAEGVFEDQKISLLMPMTFMNNSGVAVHKVVNKKGISSEDVLVICDDFHLDFQKIRLRAKGSDGGHNGLNSVIRYLETEEFPRLRMGIGAPPGKKDVVDFVLEKFTKKEIDCLDSFVDEAASCCLVWLREGIEAAMDQHNRRR